MLSRIKTIFAPKNEIRVSWKGNLLHEIYLRSQELIPDSDIGLWDDVVRISRIGEIGSFGIQDPGWKNAEQISNEFLIIFDGIVVAIATLRELHDRAEPMPEGSDQKAKEARAKREQLKSQWNQLKQDVIVAAQKAFLRLEKELDTSRSETDFSRKILIAKSRLEQGNQLLRAFDDIDNET